MVMKKISFCLILIAVLFILDACNPYAQVESDKKKYTPVSKDRVIGSECYVGDGAAITRRSSHPLGPTGGWGKDKYEIDPKKTKSVSNNVLQYHHWTLSGYLKFTEDGYLKVRSYDDVYGEVYCSWAPGSLTIPVSKMAVLVRLPVCVVGDGGLDQVHEVCWFPKGSEKGEIIYSSKHAAKASSISVTELFELDQLGSKDYFYDRLAFDVMAKAVKERNLSLAEEVLERSILLLSQQQGAVDGSTNEPISPEVFHQDKWVELLAYKLGVELGTPKFEKTLERLRSIIALKTLGGVKCFPCQYISEYLPLYEYMNQKLLGKKAVINEKELGSTNYHSWGRAIDIAKYLKGEKSEEEFLKKRFGTTASYNFWVGAKKYSDGDKENAKRHFATSLETWKTGPNGALQGIAALRYLSKTSVVIAD